MEQKEKEFVKFGVDEIVLEIVSEPFVINTYRGYAPVVDAKLEGEQKIKTMYINAKSLADPLSKMVKQNGNKFTGLKLKIKKESKEKMAPYIVEESK